MTRNLGLLAVLGFLAACGSKTTGTGGGNNTIDPCEGKSAVPYPEFNQSGVYYRTSIEFDMGGDVEADASITVDAGGTAVAGSSAVDGERVIFTPDAPLAASTAYNMTLNWTCGPTTSNFTTGDIGSPATPASLIGKTYALNLGSGRFVEPPGVGDIIGGLLDQEVLLGVTDATDSIVHIMGALGDGVGQDMCSESFDFPVDATFDENPYFEVQSDQLTLDIEGISIVIDDLEVSGAFSANGDQIAGAVLKGTLDVSILADLVGSDPCGMLVAFGVTCQPCPSNPGVNTCLSVNVDSMVADEVAGVTLDTVTADDIACNAACGTVTATGCP